MKMAKEKTSRLGTGLSALFGEEENVLENETVQTLPISRVEPRKDQPRREFDPAAIEELAASIREYGLIQPITVRPLDKGYYQIIAGERRWRASKMAGLTEVPVIIKEIDDETAALLSLIENLQREDLNPVEEANGYKELMDSFGFTQEEAARKVGKSRTAVANLLRILNLPDSILQLVTDGALSYGHSRTLLPLLEHYDEEKLFETANNVAESGISVRETEKLVKRLLSEPEDVPERSNSEKEYYSSLEKRIGGSIGRKAAISPDKNGGGKLILRYSSGDDLEGLIKSLCGNDFFKDDNE